MVYYINMQKITLNDKNFSYAPVAIFACRRPSKIKNLINSLQQCSESKYTTLYIFIGGPKNPLDWPKVKEVLEIALTVRGFAEVRVRESYNTLTGANLIKSGVETVLKDFDRIIVLEDDLEVRSDFLLYMNSALDKYADLKDIAQVSAWNFGTISSSLPNQAYLFPVTTSWGWATWKRAWSLKSESTHENFTWLVKKSARIHKFNYSENYDVLSMIERVLSEGYDAWDAEFYLHCFRNSNLTVFPNSSLVINGGFDGSGLNFGKSFPWKTKFEESPQTKFLFPDQIRLSKKYKTYLRYQQDWVQTFWPTSNFRFFIQKLKRKRRQHLKYYNKGFYGIF
jgi:hypothetical protein